MKLIKLTEKYFVPFITASLLCGSMLCLSWLLAMHPDHFLREAYEWAYAWCEFPVGIPRRD